MKAAALRGAGELVEAATVLERFSVSAAADPSRSVRSCLGAEGDQRARGREDLGSYFIEIALP